MKERARKQAEEAKNEEEEDEALKCIVCYQKK